MHHAAEQPDQGLSEIALRIRDLSAMTPFYSEIMGLEVIRAAMTPSSSGSSY